jgi:hypothetical protein
MIELENVVQHYGVRPVLKGVTPLNLRGRSAPAVSAGVMALLGMGPDLKVWRLTGNHRIAMGRRKLEQAG